MPNDAAIYLAQIAVPDLPLALSERRGADFLPIAIENARIAIEQANIPKSGPSVAWLAHPSNQKMLIYQGYVNGDDSRRNGGQLTLAHLIGVAFEVANDPVLLAEGHDPAFLAFLGLTHDTKEAAMTFGLNQPETVIYAVACWNNPDKIEGNSQREYAESTIDHLTDRATGPPRIFLQAVKTATLDRVQQTIRVHDKINQAEGDASFLRRRLDEFEDTIHMDFLPDPARVRRSVDTANSSYLNAVERMQVVHAAYHLRDELIARHVDAVVDLRNLHRSVSDMAIILGLDRHLPRLVSAGEELFIPASLKPDLAGSPHGQPPGASRKPTLS